MFILHFFVGLKRTTIQVLRRADTLAVVKYVLPVPRGFDPQQSLIVFPPVVSLSKMAPSRSGRVACRGVAVLPSGVSSNRRPILDNPFFEVAQDPIRQSYGIREQLQ